jgi:hypothetical protein
MRSTVLATTWSLYPLGTARPRRARVASAPTAERHEAGGQALPEGRGVQARRAHRRSAGVAGRVNMSFRFSSRGRILGLAVQPPCEASKNERDCAE